MSEKVLWVPFILAALIAVTGNLDGADQEQTEMGTLVVTGTRLTRDLGDSGRDISILDRDAVAAQPADFLADLLQSTGLADIQARGPFGVQSDLCLRGSTFQQTLVLIDGVGVNDSQTSHHDMDLPVTLSDLARVEILRGACSSAYGPGAFAGAVNLVTRKPRSLAGSASVTLGEDESSLVSAVLEDKWDHFGQRLSVEQARSSGFVPDRDFNHLTVSSCSTLDTTGNASVLTLGMMDKAFGAYDFYTPGLRYASREWTKTWFGSLGSDWDLDPARFKTSFFYRWHHDRFLLDQSRPAFFLSEHATQVWGGSLETSWGVTDRGKGVVGGEAAADEITSTTMGDHSRPREAVFTEYQWEVGDGAALNAGVRADHSVWDWQCSPSADLSWRFQPGSKARFSIGQAFRSPSFTELYYADPVNFGNARLVPEQALSYEAGLDHDFTAYSAFSVTCFRRDQRNTIDWVGDKATGPWRAQNIGIIDFFGVETQWKARWGGAESSIGYTWTSSDRINAYTSKYALVYPGQTVSCGLTGPVWESLSGNLNVLYRTRLGFSDACLVSAKLVQKAGPVDIFAEGTNLLNQFYEDIQGVPQPGRWLGGGTKVSF